jgi:HK97 family phage portal protein
VAFVISSGRGSWVDPPPVPAFGAPVGLGDGVYADQAMIWQSQRSVRTVVSFLARNIAQLGLHWYRRVSDTDRVRDTTHPLVQLLAHPNPLLRLTPYRLFDRLVHDLGIYDNAFWVKVRAGGAVSALVPVPPPRIRPQGGNWLAPATYEIWTDGRWREIAAENVVHFHGYDPIDPRVGNSPINALRDLLLEEYEATRSRRQMWRNGARLSGVIERPKDAPDWGPTARARFKAGWRASYSSDGGDAGGTPLLEDGMTYKAVGLDPKAAQYVESRKLTREEAASAYHVSPIFVGVLDHATFSNVVEQHKNLYQDTLGPWLEFIQQDIAEQLLPDFRNADDLYPEFNIAAKMAGSFEEQAAAASTATGAPWMTRNEQRARMNLPALPGGDELITPLNVLVGGLASPRDTAPKATAALLRGKARLVGTKADDLTEARTDLAGDLAGFFDYQRGAVIAALARKANTPLEQAWDAVRWNTELAAKLFRHARKLAGVGALEVLARWNPDGDGFAEANMDAWLAKASQTNAETVNFGLYKRLMEVEKADQWRELVAEVFEHMVANAPDYATTIATEAVNFGRNDAAKATGLAVKRWYVTSTNPRATHVAMNGEQALMGETFTNGARWPGDARLHPAERVNCTCAMEFDVE